MNETETHSVPKTNIDSVPDHSRQPNEYKTGFLKTKLFNNLIKYGIWLLFSLVFLFTPIGRWLGDLAYERGYPYATFIWGGMALLVYLIYSIITFYFDWHLNNTTAYEHGIHSMPSITVFGRWLRKTFVDCFGFFFISLYMLLCFYFPNTYPTLYGLTETFTQSNGASPSWWVLGTLIAIILIPLYFIVRRALLTLMGNSVKRVVKSSQKHNLVPTIILGAFNIIAIVVMWYIFNRLGFLTYNPENQASSSAWFSLSLLITVSWAVLFVLMLIGKLRNRESQINIVYLLGISFFTLWVFFQTMGMLAQSESYVFVRIGFFTILAFLVPIILTELISIFNTVTLSDEKYTAIKQLCTRFSVIPLGICVVGVDGDTNVETKVYGSYGLYYIYIPENLLDKPELYASIAHALAKIKGGTGTVLTIVRTVLFGLTSICAWYLFDLSYNGGQFMWFSGTTGDPLLVVALLLLFGFFFGIIGRPVVGFVSKMMDKAALKSTSTLIEPKILESYEQLVSRSYGEEGAEGGLAMIYANDRYLAD